MYAEAELLLPFLQESPQRAAVPHGGEQLGRFHADFPNGETHMVNIVQISTVSGYDLGGEGDLFKAPEPIIEEPVLELDPVTVAISMAAGDEDIITAGTMKVPGMESIQNKHLFSEIFYECQKDLLAMSIIAESCSEVADSQTSVMGVEENPVMEGNRFVAEGLIQNCSGCLNSEEWIKVCAMRPYLLNFQELDLGDTFGLRRTYSEGDIETFGSGNLSLGNTSTVHPSLATGDLNIEDKIEERKQKLSRYRQKKTQRNFGRKIKLSRSCYTSQLPSWSVLVLLKVGLSRNLAPIHKALMFS